MWCIFESPVQENKFKPYFLLFTVSWSWRSIVRVQLHRYNKISNVFRWTSFALRKTFDILCVLCEREREREREE